jgi:hypothetical protein
MTYPARKIGKIKRKDTLFKKIMEIKLADDKPSEARFKLTSTEYN